jgi:hypothetical protein
VLASFDEGLELPVVVQVTPLFMAAPPVVVLLFISSPVVAFEAGSPACALRRRSSFQPGHVFD